MTRFFLLSGAFLLLVAGCGARTGIKGAEDDAGTTDADERVNTAPTASCYPVETWTTIGRRAEVYGSAEDDGWISSYSWQIAERPSGSVVELVPPESENTSLTPDAVGDYLLVLTVTDNEDATSSCQTVVHSIVGPPVAFCPEDISGAISGRSYTLVGGGFDDVMIVEFRWEITQRPTGSVAELNPTDGTETVFTPDVAGSFEITLTVIDNDGETGSCSMTVTSSGPPTAICPEETTVPTRQPHTVQGEGEDDEGIVAWSWELSESPPSSTASPSPRDAQQTVLTPDRVGRYTLRLTVTDGAGLTDSCEAIINASPTAPDALCPDTTTTTPLTEVTLRGNGVDDGVIVGWEWELYTTPPGSSASPPHPSDTQETQFIPDVAGEYELQLTVTDNDGMEGSCIAQVNALPSEGLRVELYWNPPDTSCDSHPGPDCDRTDVDLHLLHPEASHWFDSSSGQSDCFYANCTVRGGLEWDAPGVADNPRLDLDDVEGFGPENINIDEPVVGNSYTVGVHYFSDDGTDRAAECYIRIYCGTIDVDPVYTVGPVNLFTRGGVDGNDFWRVATVEWDGFSCMVAPLYTASGNPDIIRTSEARSHR